MGLLNDVVKFVQKDDQNILELKLVSEESESDADNKNGSEEWLKALIKKN